MWCYKSKVGLMRIYPSGSRYLLEINDVVYGSYQNPIAAADDVASFATGCYEWDSLETVINNYPADISEWDRMTAP